MNFSFFDLHCDTATELFAKRATLEQNDLAVSLKHAESFDRYCQVMAIWTDHTLDDESGWKRLCDVLQYLRADAALQNGKAKIVSDTTDSSNGTSLFLAVEDARILNRKISRLEELYQWGFRILTPLWAGETCIGGSHDTSAGLTDFGKDAVREAIDMGMIPDVSHASVKSADQIFDLAAKKGRPVIASHSNAYELCGVSRNLHPHQIQAILSLGGVIGLNLYRHFLSAKDNASREDVLRHVEYFLEHGCENALCFGCDMDGADLPDDLPNLAAIPSLREYLSRYYSEDLLNRLFFQNAYHFAERSLHSSAKNL